MDLKIKKLNDNAIIPRYGSESAFCFDLAACLNDDIAVVRNDQTAIIPTGLAFEIPPGWGMLIFSRSGHGFKSDIRLANCAGVIDADYRGEVMVKLTSDSIDRDDCMIIKHGDRIAQAVLVQAPAIAFVLAEELSETERGEGGFGSTGIESEGGNTD